MRKTNEIVINGIKLSDILKQHASWLAEPAGEEEHTPANLRNADLRGADLRNADIDFSCWPLWCGSNNVKVDVKIAAQLAAHFCALDCDDPAFLDAREKLLAFARKSHRASDLNI